MRESKIFCIKNFYPYKWTKIKKINFVYREKEFYNHPAIGIWWNKNRGIGIKDKPLEFTYIMIGLNLINHTTWLEFTYLKKLKKKATGLVTSNPDSYIKS